ncbi:MAG: cupin domain-containing protein [Thermomicrobiales bacterium]
MAPRHETTPVPDEPVFARPVTEPATEDLAFQPVWARKDDLPTFAPITGLYMQSMTGGRIMVNWVTIEPNQAVPRHQHPHEQAGVMLEGTLALTIGDETRTLRPGDAYAIPPDLPHNAVAGDEGCVVLDIFSPPRDDYIAMVDQ